MRQYLDLIENILNENYLEIENNNKRPDRTGVGTYSIFGPQLTFNLEKGFPLLTTKKLYLKGIIHELLWVLSGSTNVKYLEDNGVFIWSDWKNENGDLGPIYGKLWRRWEGPDGVIDQIQKAINTLKQNPYSRRNLVIAYNPADTPKKAPQGCHTLFQFYVKKDKLSLKLYQRSADLMLGVPFNIASYSLLLMMVAQVTGYKPHEFIHTFGDVHIYSNHIEGARKQIKRKPRKLPCIKLNPDIKNIFDFKYEDFILENYNPYPHIKLKIAI